MNKNFFILLLFLLILPNISSFANEDAASNTALYTQSAANSIDADIDDAIKNSTKEVVTPNVEDLKEMVPNSNEQLKEEVVSSTNKELQFTIKKLVSAMIGVVISSIIIFLICLILNKTSLAKSYKVQKKEEQDTKKEPQKSVENDDANELGATYDSETEALKIFFEKTK